MIVCSRCRNRNIDTAEKCRLCGFPLTPPALPEEQKLQLPPDPTPPPTPPPPPELPLETVKKHSEPLPELREPTPDPPPVIPGPPLDEPEVHSAEIQDTPHLPEEPILRKEESASGLEEGHPAVVPPLVSPLVTPPAPYSRLAWIAAVLMGFGGGASGYFVGAHNAAVQQPSGGQTPAQQAAELTRDRQQLKLANQTLTARDAQIQILQRQVEQLQVTAGQAGQADEAARAKDAKLRAMQQRMAAEEAQAAIDAKSHQAAIGQLQSASNAAAEKMRQTEAQLAARTAELNSMRAAKATAPVKAQVRTGEITWTGNVNGDKMIEIRDGWPRTEGTFSGSLPGIPVQVRALDPNIVTIKTAPGTGHGNNWNRLKFQVRGHGNVTATVVWTAE